MRSAEHLPLALALPPTAVVIPEDMLRQVPVVLRIRVARADTRRHHDIVVAFDVAVPVVRRLDHAREELVRRGLGAGDGRDGGGVERVPEGDGEVERELRDSEQGRSSSKAEDDARVICRRAEALQRGCI